MMKKKLIIGIVSAIALGVGLWYLLFYPWVKMGESTGYTCKACGSNMSKEVYYGRFGFAETGRLDRITFRGPGFETCAHKWEPGYNPIENGTSNQVPEDTARKLADPQH